MIRTVGLLVGCSYGLRWSVEGETTGNKLFQGVHTRRWWRDREIVALFLEAVVCKINRVGDFRFCIAFYGYQVGCSGLQVGSVGDGECSRELVTSQHPKGNTSLLQQRNGFRDATLEKEEKKNGYE